MIKAGLIVSAGLLLGRVAGFLREVLIASTFGASAEADIVILALTIPDLLVNILVGGALSAALIPEFKRLGQPQAASLFIQASLVAALGFAAIAAIASLISTPLVFAFAPGLDATSMTRAAGLVGLTLWLIPLTSLAGISRAYLQAHDRFGIESLGTLIYNLAVIAGLVLVAAEQGGLRLVCAFVILGGFLRWGSQLMVLPRPLFLSQALRQRLVDRKLMIRFLQVSSAGGLLLLLPVVARALASYSGEGAIASFNYAIKLTEFALGATITVLAVAIFPKLSESFAARDEARFGALLAGGLWWLMLLALATTVPLLWFSRDFVELAYGWGRMTDVALNDVTLLMTIGLISLPFQGLVSLLTVTANARRDAWGPLQANMAVLLIFLPLGAVLRGLYGLPGIMFALVLCYALAALAQIILLTRRHHLAVGRMLFKGETLKTMAFVLLVCSGVGTMAGEAVPALTGVVLAILSAIIAVGVCLLLHPEYRELLLVKVRKR
jgi:murein biosynthesis integral membrane protein MurJ